MLSPLLFLCLINDLQDTVKSTVRLFADDCLLYREVRSFQDRLTLQSYLKSLEEWAARWGMRFNTQKCYVLSTKPRSHFYYRLGGTILKHVEQNSYIGIQIFADLKWSTHITGLGKKARSTLGFLRRNLRNCIQAARFITSDYRSRELGCIGRMLDFLDLPPLEERRRQFRLTMLY